MRKYEGMFIIKPDIDEKGEGRVVDSIKESISKNGGKVTLAEKWNKRQLAYPIKRHREGIYYRFEFEIDPAAVSVLKKEHKLNEDIIRELIIVR